MIIVLAMNAYCLIHIWPDWNWFIIGNLIFGVITTILMWVVQCSDPGI